MRTIDTDDGNAWTMDADVDAVSWLKESIFSTNSSWAFCRRTISSCLAARLAIAASFSFAALSSCSRFVSLLLFHALWSAVVISEMRWKSGERSCKPRERTSWRHQNAHKNIHTQTHTPTRARNAHVRAPHVECRGWECGMRTR